MFELFTETSEKARIAGRVLWITCTFTICTVATWIIFKIPNFYEFRNHDWYLGIQLIEVAKKFSEDYWINPYSGFYDPSNPGKLLFGNHLFSSGMLIWSPDVLLFRFFSTVNCLKIHYLFSLFVAVCSLNYVKSRLNLGFLSALSLSLTWVLSGPIVGRMSEGHIQLTGYLFIPTFLCLVDEAIKSRGAQSGRQTALNLALLICFVVALGSTHVLVQFSLVLLIAGLVYKSARKICLTATLMGWLFSAFQFIPGMLSPSFEWSTRSVYQGYGWRFWENFFNGRDYYQGSLPEIVTALLKSPLEITHHFIIALTDSTFAIRASGWEWTLGIGLIPTLILISLNFKNFRETMNFLRGRKYLMIVLMLSIGISYRILYLGLNEFLPIPAVDRVPYRMGIYVFAALLLISFQNVEKMRKDSHISTKLFSLAISVSIPILVGIQSLGWFERLQTESYLGLGIPQIQLRDYIRDKSYETSVLLSFFVSFASLVTALIYRRTKLSRKVLDKSE
jgi:hypothetical protein